MLPYKPFLGDNPTIVPISNSEIQTYKDCRRKWYLSYYLGLGAERKMVGALAFGTRVHRALELLYKNGEDPLSAWSDLIRIDQEILIERNEDLADLTKEAELGRIMLEGYLEWLEETGADSDLEVIGVEKSLSAKILNDRVELRGKIDMRVKRKVDGVLIPFDFKTVAQYDTYTKIAHMAEQLKLYNLLETINAENGEIVGGGKYRLLKKVKRSPRAVPPFYRDFDVRHNKTTLNNFWTALHGVVRDMITLRDQLDAGVDPAQIAYPTPTNDCTWKCLTGDTEVITKQGIRAIKDLSGTRPELFVPTRYDGKSFTHGGVWKRCDVREFGVQEVVELHVRKGRQTKVIRTTKDHLWWIDRGQRRVETQNLEPGTALPEARSNSWKNVKPVPPVIAQGFVFGDGTYMGQGSNAMLDIFDPKDQFILDYFALHPQKRITRTNKIHGKKYETTCTRVYQIPERWKTLPSFQENTSFLCSWLAGYFAADGSVSKSGQAVLHSASIENLLFVRDICSLVGIPHGTILRKSRKGTGEIYTPIYSINFDARKMPTWMFLNDSHRARITQKLTKKSRTPVWKVERVVKTGIEEPVYCAVVPDTEAFVLADSIVTSNCPFYTACPMFDDGSAVVDYVQDNFTQYDPYERYKEENE